MNYYGTLAYTLLNCVSYMGPTIDRMPPDFWLNFAIAVLSVVFAVMAVAVTTFRRNALMLDLWLAGMPTSRPIQMPSACG